VQQERIQMVMEDVKLVQLENTQLLLVLSNATLVDVVENLSMEQAVNSVMLESSQLKEELAKLVKMEHILLILDLVFAMIAHQVLNPTLLSLDVMLVHQEVIQQMDQIVKPVHQVNIHHNMELLLVVNVLVVMKKIQLQLSVCNVQQETSPLMMELVNLAHFTLTQPLQEHVLAMCVEQE